MRRASRWAIGILRVSVLAYLGICAALFLKQQALIYPSGLTKVASADTDYEFARGAVVLRGWLFNPGARNAILYFGGNAEQVEPAARWLATAVPDSCIYALAYRGYGASDGTPDEQALVADAVSLFDHVRLRQPAASIALIGRSLGSGIASQVAARRSVDRLVLVTPFDSLEAVAAGLYPFLPVRWLLKDRYDSVTALRSYRGPMLVVRAARDRIIPPERTDRLLAALDRDIEAVTLEQSGHDDIEADPRYRAALVGFLQSR